MEPTAAYKRNYDVELSMIDTVILKIKRGETPFFRFLQRRAKAIITSRLPLPRGIHPLLRGLFGLHQASLSALRRTAMYFYGEPLFRGRCEAVGRRFMLWRMPYVVSHAKIYIGDDVKIFGKVDIFSGRTLDDPTLIIHNRVDIGHNVSFVVNREIVIEDDVLIASGVRFMDTDGHPKDLAERTADFAPKPEEIKSVRVCRNAWICQNVFILKGVTIGEGAVIAVNSVVLSDIPPHTLAAGNPARVVKNLRVIP
jgi:acetyltransferase-like isoleucine patch superfamily enzyme